MSATSTPSGPLWPASGAGRGLRADVGQLMCVGFPGLSISDETRALLTDYAIGSVIYFKRNVESAPQVARLSREIEGLGPRETPILVTADQEGGAVARFRGITTDFPAMAALGATGDEGLAHAFGACLGEELTALGVGLDFAPVVDVNTNPDNPVIGNRAFGADPHLVARMAVAQWRGMDAAGLLACAKHFPGHGDTLTDSHKGLPVVPHDLARLEAVELLPFAAAIKAGIPAIMTAHVLFPAVDPHRPATLSPEVVGGLLRGRLGFDGVVATDDLEMAAVAEDPGVEEAVVLALTAGVDLFLICHRADRQVAAWEALVRAGERSVELRERIRQSAARVRALKARLEPEGAASPDEIEALLRSPLATSLAAEIKARGEAALAAAGVGMARSPDPTAAPDDPSV